MDLMEKEIGEEAKVVLTLGGGKIMLTGMADTAGMDVSVAVSVDTDYFIDQLAAKIPGTLDDAILAVLKGALKTL